MGARTVSSDEDEIDEREDDDVEDNEAINDDDEDEEDEEEGQDEYEKDDFIVDDVDEEEEEEEARESSDDEVKTKKKKRKKRDTDELDEDDYALLQEANVTGFRQKSSSKTKFKRLKKAGRVTNDGGRSAQMGFSDDNDFDEGNRHGRSAEEELKRSLFGDDEEAPQDDIAEEQEAEEEEEELDEMADFIVDECDMDENGQPIRRNKTRRKGPRQAAGISSMALQEAQDIFGDVTELLDRRKDTLHADRLDEDLDEDGYSRRRVSSKKLEDEFEPSILKEKYMTAEDNRIREIDVPERLQLLEEAIGPIPTKEPKHEEAEWIYDQGFGYPFKEIPKEFERVVEMSKSNVVREIEFVLMQLHDYKLEIPFIGMYRKEGCIDLIGDPESHDESNLRDFKLLWQISAMDKKWWLLQRRKDRLLEAYHKRSRIEEDKDSENIDVLRRLISALQEARSEVAVDDVEAKYSLHFPPDDAEVDQGQFKRPKRRSLYSIFRKSGLAVVAKQFGLTADQLGENLQACYKRHEVEDSSSMPEDVAAELISKEVMDPQSVLRGARHMAAVEIFTEPNIREYVRNIFMDRAVVNTKPTKEGHSVIDPYHEYAPVKWIVDKPLHEFKDGQWSIIQKAEEEKLLEVTVGLSQKYISSLMNEFEIYLSDGVSRTAQLWNEQRRQIIKDAVMDMLLPSLEKEARTQLHIRAKQWVARECGGALWKKVSTGPWKPENSGDQYDHSDEDEAPRVMACCYGGSSSQPTTFVMLDSSGEILNILYTPHLVSESHISDQDPRKRNDSRNLMRFLVEGHPDIIVIGAAGQKSLTIKSQINQAIYKITEEAPRDLGEGQGLENINKDLVDESMARIYETSNISKEQLPGQPGIVRRAAYLGRYLQNPLAMVAALCGPDREILSSTLHGMQSFLTDDERYAVIEQIMVTVTNQVGVDINMAAVHEWLFAPLQFVCGLGPRKATSMQRSVQGVGRINTRREMLTSLYLMKKTVFINACAFLRVRSSGQAASGNLIMDPLDDTRIHPESYELAKKMAQTVYIENQRQKNEEVDEDLLEICLEHVKDNPNLLKTLDVEEYSKMLHENEGISKLYTLRDIHMELMHGYKEWRYPYHSPSEDELFTLMTGETDETMGVGRLVTVKVKEVTSRGVKCDMGNGLQGYIQKDDLTDDGSIDPQERVSGGSMITCRIKNIKKSVEKDEKDRPPRFYSVDLTCKESAMQTDDWERIQLKEPYFSKEALNSHNQQEKEKKAKDDEKRKSFKPRMIVHPQFRNVSMAEAIEALAEKDVGEIVIRPSSKGPTHLTITLKFYDGVYTHIDIAEGGKDKRDVTSFLSLGKTLKIGEDTFEDLDEVIACYVDPLVSNLKEMLRYRKFRKGKRDEIDAILKQEKAANPLRIVYAFSVSFEHPGAFMLSYLKNVNVHHEYVSLYPKGYRFRKKMFDTIDRLVNHFQKHVNDVPVETNRSLAAMVPMKSPAPSSGGWGASNSSGWDNDGWSAPKAPGPSSWDRGATPVSRTPSDWSNHSSRGDSWGRGASQGGTDGWRRDQGDHYGGRGGRGDAMGGGGRFGGRKPDGRGGFRGGRGGRGRGGGRWESRDDGQNNRDSSSWSQGRGGWSNQGKSNRDTPTQNDDGWGQGRTSSFSKPDKKQDDDGWGQQTQTPSAGGHGSGWSSQPTDSNVWGQAPAQDKATSGWGQPTPTATSNDDGW